ncbi:hypothetical protein HY490_04885 [Candidatus Woesearchaeota archaeon]|nr:hypothetical protein [Candidatus Woesearchaeota archaeon]
MKLEHVVLVLVILGAVAGLYLRNVPFTGGNLDLDAPPLRTSYDVFANTEHIKWIYDSEQSYVLAPSRAGGISNALNAQNPLYYVLIATFTKLTTLNPYQTSYLVLNLLSVFIVLCVFVLVERAFGPLVGIVTAFLGFFPHAHWLFPMYIGFQYDYHTYQLLAGIFVLLLYLVLSERKTPAHDAFVFALIGVLLAGITMSHYSELFFYIPFVALVLASVLWFFRMYSLVYKSVVFSIPFVLFILFFLYYYPLTAHVHLTGGISGQISNQINPERARHVDYFPWPRFNTVLNVLSLAGLVFVGLMGVSRKLDVKKWLVFAVIAYILFVGTSNYTLNVWANRAERQLFLGHSFFVLLPALGVIGAVMALTKDRRVVFAVALIASLAVPYFVFAETFGTLETIGKGTYFDDNKWSAVRWVRDNTAKDAKIFFMNGYIHEFQMFAERIELKGDLNLGHTQENIQRACNREWPDPVVGDWGFRDPPTKGFLTKRTGWYAFEYTIPFEGTPLHHQNMTGYQKDSVPLDVFDYVVLQFRGTEGYDPCMAWFVNASLSRNYSIAFNNPTMVILEKK